MKVSFDHASGRVVVSLLIEHNTSLAGLRTVARKLMVVELFPIALLRSIYEDAAVFPHLQLLPAVLGAAKVHFDSRVLQNIL